MDVRSAVDRTKIALGSISALKGNSLCPSPFWVMPIAVEVHEMWVGTWKNQFGSVVEITSEADGKIEGTFRTALEDSGFYGQTVPIFGAHKGNCIGFSSASNSPTGDRVVSYTGLLRDGKMETAWFVVADKTLSASAEGEPAQLRAVNWWRAVVTNVDTFERLA